jgi:thiamine biosynthesis lipoprotein
MGTSAHVVVNGPRRLVGEARARIEDLEQRWSRFRPDSEVSRLNRHGCARVSPETEELVTKSITGWSHTGGRFDPTVYRSMVAIGYSTTFADISSAPTGQDPGPAPGCGGIELGAGVVRLPDGVGFDPGGIGKGLAADIVAVELSVAGADGIVVNLGGDLRAAGESEAGVWVIRIDEPAAQIRETVAIAAGGVATSTPLRRTWSQGGARRHHLIDPGSGQPFGALAPTLVSVVAAEAWWAEVLTKAAMSVPRALLNGMLEPAAALVSYADGSREMVNGIEQYLQ